MTTVEAAAPAAMTPADLVTHLRERGARLFLADDRLRIQAHVGTLGPELTQALKDHRDEIVEILRTEAQFQAPLSDAEIAPLVERYGKLMAHYQQHSESWNRETWERNHAKLLKGRQEMDAALYRGRPGMTFAEWAEEVRKHGWQVSDHGHWFRVGEEPPLRQLTPLQTALRAAYERVGTLLAIHPGLDATDPEWEHYELQIEAAFLDGDLGAMEQACADYVAFVEGLAAALPAVAAVVPGDLDARRAALLERVRLNTWPAKRLAPGVWVNHGETNWTAFCQTAPEEWVALAERLVFAERSHS